MFMLMMSRVARHFGPVMRAFQLIIRSLSALLDSLNDLFLKYYTLWMLEFHYLRESLVLTQYPPCLDFTTGIITNLLLTPNNTNGFASTR